MERKGNLGKKIKTVLQRIISFFAFISFFISQHFNFPLYAQFPTDISQGFPENLSLVTVPEDAGKIEEIFKGESDSVVVLLQDAHAIPDAQRNIQKLIHHFQKEYGVDLIALEGAATELDAQFFKSFPDQKILKKILDSYLERGEITGATMAALFNEGQAVYQGIEDWPLYEEGLGLYLKAMAREGEALNKIAALKEALQKQKVENYSKELLEIDLTLDRLYEDHSHFLAALKKLAQVKAPEKESELALILEEAGKEEEDSPAIQGEVKKIASEVKRYLEHTCTETKARRMLSESSCPKALVRFNQKDQEFKTSLISAKGFVLFMQELMTSLCHVKKPSDEKFLNTEASTCRLSMTSELEHLVNRQKRMRDIEGANVFHEFETYAELVKESLFRNEEERKLDQESQRLKRLERLARLELNREDWEIIKSDSAERLEKQVNLSLFENILFYRNADGRDAVFFQNLVQQMKEKKANSSVFVAGGFHMEGLTNQLKESGISYILLTPQIRSLPQNNPYRNFMRGQVSWSDYFRVENGRVNLYDAFIRATRDRLLRSAEGTDAIPHAPSAMLKSWRDQIIGDLAPKGQIIKVSQYTRFIDELATTENRPEWRIKLDRFVESLRGLDREGKLTKQNIIQLLQPATTLHAAGGNANLAVGTMLSASHLPVLRSDSRSETRAIPPVMMKDYVLKPGLEGAKQAIRDTMDWLIKEGYPYPEVLRNYRDSIEHANNIDEVYSSQGLHVVKNIRLEEKTLIQQIGLNGTLIHESLVRIKQFASIDYFIEVFSVFVQEAWGLEVMKWAIMTGQVEKNSKKAEELWKKLISKTGNFIWPNSETSRVFQEHEHETEIMNLAAFAHGVEFLESMWRFEMITWAKQRGLYDPERLKNWYAQKGYWHDHKENFEKFVSTKGDPLQILVYEMQLASQVHLSLFNEGHHSASIIQNVLHLFMEFDHFLKLERADMPQSRKMHQEKGRLDYRILYNYIDKNKTPPSEWFLSSAERLLPLVLENVKNFEEWRDSQRSEVRTKKLNIETLESRVALSAESLEEDPSRNMPILYSSMNPNENASIVLPSAVVASLVNQELDKFIPAGVDVDKVLAEGTAPDGDRIEVVDIDGSARLRITPFNQEERFYSMGAGLESTAVYTTEGRFHLIVKAVETGESLKSAVFIYDSSTDILYRISDTRPDAVVSPALIQSVVDSKGNVLITKTDGEQIEVRVIFSVTTRFAPRISPDEQFTVSYRADIFPITSPYPPFDQGNEYLRVVGSTIDQEVRVGKDSLNVTGAGFSVTNDGVYYVVSLRSGPPEVRFIPFSNFTEFGIRSIRLPEEVTTKGIRNIVFVPDLPAVADVTGNDLAVRRVDLEGGVALFSTEGIRKAPATEANQQLINLPKSSELSVFSSPRDAGVITQEGDLINIQFGATGFTYLASATLFYDEPIDLSGQEELVIGLQGDVHSVSLGKVNPPILALEDENGNIARLNLEGMTKDEQIWFIPKSLFSGIDLKNIKKVVFGVPYGYNITGSYMVVRINPTIENEIPAPMKVKVKDVRGNDRARRQVDFDSATPPVVKNVTPPPIAEKTTESLPTPLYRAIDAVFGSYDFPSEELSLDWVPPKTNDSISHSIASLLIKGFKGRVLSDSELARVAGGILQTDPDTFIGELFAAAEEEEREDQAEEELDPNRYFDAIQSKINQVAVIEYHLPQQDPEILKKVFQAARDASSFNQHVVTRIIFPEEISPMTLALLGPSQNDARALGNRLAFYNPSLENYENYLKDDATITITDSLKTKGPVLHPRTYADGDEIEQDKAELILVAALIWVAETLSERTFKGIVKSSQGEENYRIANKSVLDAFAFAILQRMRSELRIAQAA